MVVRHASGAAWDWHPTISEIAAIRLEKRKS